MRYCSYENTFQYLQWTKHFEIRLFAMQLNSFEKSGIVADLLLPKMFSNQLLTTQELKTSTEACNLFSGQINIPRIHHLAPPALRFHGHTHTNRHVRHTGKIILQHNMCVELSSVNMQLSHRHSLTNSKSPNVEELAPIDSNHCH